MEVNAGLDIKEKFNDYILSRLPGFKVVSRLQERLPTNLSYCFSLEPILGEIGKGIDPSEVFLSGCDDECVVPVIGLYSFSKEGYFNLFSSYLISSTVLSDVLQKLSKNSCYKGRIGGSDLRDLFSNRLSGTCRSNFSRDRFAFKLTQDSCPIRGVLLDKQYDQNALAYLHSQNWLSS